MKGFYGMGRAMTKTFTNLPHLSVPFVVSVLSTFRLSKTKISTQRAVRTAEKS
jgi:hypothetical protein